MITRHVLARAIALMAAIAAPSLAQADQEITISRQPGILYMPIHVIEKQRLIEKHAERLGVPGLTIKWLNFSNGGAQQDALIAGGVDFINTGTGQLLLLWDRTKGGVKGVAATTAAPLTLISRDPRIKTLADFGAGDKIAVPTVKVSTQAILLQIAAAKMFGKDQWSHFDPFTVQLGHPDAYIAMKSPGHEVKSHFAAPPFHYYELKNVPDAHVITTSGELIGGPLTQGQFIATTKFAEANPRIIAALLSAAEDAKRYIESDTKGAIEIYREITTDKTPTEDLLALLAQPGMMEWNLYPQGTMKFAAHLNSVGTLKTMPGSWRDYYFSTVHAMPGN